MSILDLLALTVYGWDGDREVRCRCSRAAAIRATSAGRYHILPSTPHCGVRCDVCVDTLAEVERLRTALGRIVQCYPDDAMTAGAMRSIAERALSAGLLKDTDA